MEASRDSDNADVGFLAVSHPLRNGALAVLALTLARFNVALGGRAQARGVVVR